MNERDFSVSVVAYVCSVIEIRVYHEQVNSSALEEKKRVHLK